MDPKSGAKKAMLAAEQLKKIAQKELVQIGQDSTDEPMALMAAFPEPVMELEEADRQRQVRQGMDSVIMLGTPPETTRGFVRAVLKVPLDHPQAQTFGVFVEVQRNAYEKLKKAFANNEEVEAPGTLATRLPLLEDAYGSKVWLREYGDHRRVVVIRAEHQLLNQGPAIGKTI